MILPSHAQIDRAREDARGANKIGTTGRGIGPAYEDKVGRRAVRLCDLADPDSLPEKIDNLLLHHNALLRGLGAAEVQAAPLLAALKEIAPKVLPYAEPVWERLDQVRRRAASVSCLKARKASCSTSIPAPIRSSLLRTPIPARRPRARASVPAAVGYVLGIAKAYSTRVGSGPFPTELTDEIVASFSANAARNSVSSPGASGAAGGSMR